MDSLAEDLRFGLRSLRRAPALSAIIVLMVLREVAVIAASGILIGLPVAWALSRFVELQLFGLSPTDPFTLLMAAIALSAVALSAGYLPARRATRVEPMLAIRDL